MKKRLVIKGFAILFLVVNCWSCNPGSRGNRLADIDLPKMVLYHKQQNQLFTFSAKDKNILITDLGTTQTDRITISVDFGLLRVACFVDNTLWMFDNNGHLIQINTKTYHQEKSNWNRSLVDGCVGSGSGDKLLLWSGSSYFVYFNEMIHDHNLGNGENILSGLINDEGSVYLSTDMGRIYRIAGKVDILELEEEIITLKFYDGYLWAASLRNLFRIDFDGSFQTGAFSLPEHGSVNFLLAMSKINGRYIFVLSTGIYELSNGKLEAVTQWNYLAIDAFLLNDSLFLIRNGGLYLLNL